LRCTDPLLSKDRETNNETIARQRRARQWTGGKAVFSAQSVPTAAHATLDTATVERRFMCGMCLDVISRKITECNSVE
jgi:hypothetical protein